MIKKLARLKYWEIACTGLAATATALLLLLGIYEAVLRTWPHAEQGAGIGYLVTSAAVSWLVTGIFIEAGFTRYRQSQADDALDQIAAALGKALSETEKEQSNG